MKGINFFAVNVANMAVVATMFERDGFTIPSPRCFGRPVKSFNLNLRGKAVKPKSQWKLAFDKTIGLLL